MRTGGQMYCETLPDYVFISLRCVRFINKISMVAEACAIARIKEEKER